jgi:hypothetical protein
LVNDAEHRQVAEGFIAVDERQYPKMKEDEGQLNRLRWRKEGGDKVN